MRSDFVQIIAVTGMILMAILAITFRNLPSPSVDYFVSARQALDSVLRSSQTIYRGNDLEQERRDAFYAEQEEIIANRPLNDATIPVSAIPQWVTPPEPTYMDDPLKPLREHIDGYAHIACSVSTSGHPYDCFTVQEQPMGYGFGEAAIRIVRRGQLTRLEDGQKSEEFTVRVPFKL
ncbi:hypothetical protein [Brevundimonas sp.]|uniref:hypothetical protein n=1 Tax=Brevundimonas sp. TaxID=1871086 RepID=UPI002FCA1924